MSEISMPFLILALYLTILLVPIVPTVLIYWLFPGNHAFVSGPLAGFSIKAGGAFGAYIIVLLGTAVWLVPKMENRMNRFEERADRAAGDLWRLKGDVVLKNSDGTDISRGIDFLNKLRVLSPSTYKYDSYGATIVFERVAGDLPTITVELPGFDVLNLDLRSWPVSKMDIDSVKRVIKAKEPIVLRRLSSGGTTGPAVAHTAREESMERPN
jgi:hypothetical protein